ncbi:CGNR zinc finger domain-containing protein [Streptomyces sp. NPDC090306]|uniref:CGNR zinc finger domain-containing protein n=1 Tax=Streptomyces sp. NPDC090306 TaxID=3365961 RepID=UPI003812A129
MLDAPASALLIEAFANTVDVELGTDELATPAGLSAWLAARELLDRPRRIGAADHALCLRLRDGVREELGAHVGETADAALLAGADEALRELPVLMSVRGGGAGGPALSPAPELSPVRAALARLAVAWTELTVTGDAARLKRCSEHACAWVFWDVSKNRSRRWCSMRVCGNRAKARRYTARQTATAPATGLPHD